MRLGQSRDQCTSFVDTFFIAPKSTTYSYMLIKWDNIFILVMSLAKTSLQTRKFGPIGGTIPTIQWHYDGAFFVPAQLQFYLNWHRNHYEKLNLLTAPLIRLSESMLTSVYCRKRHKNIAFLHHAGYFFLITEILA